MLQDWNSGKIPYYTLPPTAEENKAHLGAAVVPTWGAEFKVDEVEDDSILTQVPEEHYKFVRAAPGNSEVDMDAVPAEQMDEQMDDSEAMDDDHEESDDDDNCPDALALDDDSVGAQASDDDAEDMEAESTPTFHVTAELAPKSRAKSTVTLRAAAKSTARQVLPVVEAELELNQQSGKALKRRLKKEKKLRQLIAGGVEVDAEGDAEMDEDSYDFGEFYHK